MTITELQAELKFAYETHGDIDVFVDGYCAVHNIDEVGVDVDDTGFMIWIAGAID